MVILIKNPLSSWQCIQISVCIFELLFLFKNIQHTTHTLAFQLFTSFTGMILSRLGLIGVAQSFNFVKLLLHKILKLSPFTAFDAYVLSSGDLGLNCKVVTMIESKALCFLTQWGNIVVLVLTYYVVKCIKGEVFRTN